MSIALREMLYKNKQRPINTRSLSQYVRHPFKYSDKNIENGEHPVNPVRAKILKSGIYIYILFDFIGYCAYHHRICQYCTVPSL